jgi:hypothetical protein
MKFNYSRLWQSKYASVDIGRLTFGAGYFLRNFNLGIQITRHTVTLSLGFLWLDIDWFDKEFLDWDLDWEDTNYDDEDDDLSGKP